MGILTFISAHWLEWLFTAVLAVLSWFLKLLKDQMAEEKRKNEAIAEGVKSLLRESITTNYGKYVDCGFCPISKKETLEQIYLAYRQLGGNGVAKDLYEKLLKMPTEVKEEHQKGADL